jgi:LuxR family maltose regulon positive regulatory protein
VPAWVIAATISQRVILALARGDTATATQTLAATGAEIDAPVSYATEAALISYVRLLLQLATKEAQAAQLEQALNLANRIIDAAKRDGRIGRVIETLVLRALIHQAGGHQAQALDDLRQTIALAEPEGYVRVFVNEGPALARLLGVLRDQSNSTYAAHLLTAFPKAAITQPPSAHTQKDGLKNNLSVPLTEREIDVLRAIAQGLTYEEAAQKLYVSVNTVRFHVKSLYGKLGASSRTLAIERARELGLL